MNTIIYSNKSLIETFKKYRETPDDCEQMKYNIRGSDLALHVHNVGRVGAVPKADDCCPIRKYTSVGNFEPHNKCNTNP